MKNLSIKYCLQIIKKYNPSYDQNKLDELRYGLESIYIFITKTIFILSLAYLFNLIIELLIVMLLYNFIRMTSFGLHAKKSWMCYIASSIIFILAPYLCLKVTIPIFIKELIGIISILLIFKYAPADTYKRPIISIKRRNIYKFISTFIAIFYSFTSILIINNFLSNAFLIVLIIQVIMISPLTYKIFNLPYNNYLKYIKAPINET